MNTTSDAPTNAERELQFQHTLNSACGYLELKMDDDAWAELDRLNPEDQLRAPIIKIRWYLLMRRNLHLAAARVARAGTILHPNDAAFFLLTAYAYEKQHDLAHALDVWEAAPSPVRDTAFAHYQSARYAAQMGLTQHAREHLVKAIQQQPQFTFVAESDALLSPLVHCA